MHPRELIHRINDLEGRVAELETRIQVLQETRPDFEEVGGIDKRLQSIEDWRQTFERPARERLQIRPMTSKAEIGGYQPGTKR